MIDRKYIGYQLVPFSVDVEKGQLKFFAKATGETNPIYSDETAAIAAGHPDLPAPPTFAYSLNLLKIDKVKLPDVGIDQRKVLHAELFFEYFSLIYAGDTITMRDTIIDIYDKNDGALEFLVEECIASNQHGKCVVKMRNTIVVKHERTQPCPR